MTAWNIRSKTAGSYHKAQIYPYALKKGRCRRAGFFFGSAPGEQKTHLRLRMRIRLLHKSKSKSPLKRRNTGEGETNLGEALPLRRKNTGEGEIKPCGVLPLKQENEDKGETKPCGVSPLKRRKDEKGENTIQKNNADTLTGCYKLSGPGNRTVPPFHASQEHPGNCQGLPAL